MSFEFVKGHGTGNDFVVLPDLDGSVHGDLAADVVAAVCDRRTGIGADGVLRVIRARPEAPWFMDYRNADGTAAQMCGNGVRVFARYLADEGLVDPARPLDIDTRDGVKHVTFCDDGEISVDMGAAVIGDAVKVAVAGRELLARSVETGNPHAVALVASLDEAGDLRESPVYATTDFPQGVNVEFVERRGERAVAMRVYERGVGETASCGTGACAVTAVMAMLDEAAAPTSYAVEVTGGLLTVTQAADRHLHLKGPAVLVARGILTLPTPQPDSSCWT